MVKLDTFVFPEQMNSVRSPVRPPEIRPVREKDSSNDSLSSDSSINQFGEIPNTVKIKVNVKKQEKELLRELAEEIKDCMDIIADKKFEKKLR
jgi:hypothetical protein